MELVVFAFVFLALLGLFGFAGMRMFRSKTKVSQTSTASPPDNAFEVSFAPPEFEWSGTSSGALPIKILTYKQYECLEDARYGFRIVGLPPSDRNQSQPHKTRAHGLKTVASLHKHGFLDEDGSGGYLISDRGLNALEVCKVRY